MDLGGVGERARVDEQRSRRSGGGGRRRGRPGAWARRLTTTLLAVLLLGAGAVGAAGPAHAEGDVGQITRYDVTAEVAADGTTTVVVDLDYDFGTEEAHGPRFVQPLRQRIEDDPDHWRSLPITDVTASSPSGAPAQVQTEEEGGVLQVLVGDEDVEVTGLQSYRVEWVQRGLITPDAQGPDETTLDELAWNVIGTDWQVPIGDVSVTVTGPEAVQRTGCFAGDPDELTPCTADGSDGPSATFAQDAVPPGAGLTVVTGWPAGTYATEVLLTHRVHLGNAFPPTPATVGTGVLVALVGSVAALVLSRRGRDERYAGLTPGLSPARGQEAATTTGGAGPVAVRFDPPGDARPAELGTVLDAVVHPHDVTAGIVDLAVRGHLRIVQLEADGDDAQERWRLERLEADGAGLPQHERELLSGLFRTGSQVELQGLDFAPVLARTQAALYTEVTERGWFRADPRAVRNRWYALGTALTLAGLALTAALAVTVGWGIAGAGVVVAGVVVLLRARRAPVRTAAGAALLDQALGFKLYLETAEADQIAVEEAAAVFSRYLPYAIAFGVAEHWAGVFAELAARGHRLEDPGWFVGPVPMAFAAPGFGSQMSSFSSAVSTSMTASSVSSGGGSGFSAGVGGGVGGGGGGSW